MLSIKCHRVSLLLAGLLLANVALIGCSSNDSSEELVIVDETPILKVNLDMTFQTMESFGASDAWQCNFIGKNWPLEKRNKMADLLFSKELDANGNPKGIGLSIWRFNLGSGSAEQGSASDISDEWRRSECFTTNGVSYDMNKQAGQIWFMKAARERGVEKLLAFANSAPVYLTQNQKAHATIKEFYNLADGKTNDLVDFWTTSIKKLKAEHNLEIDYFSPFNEPQYEWDGNGQEGSPATNANIFAIVSALAPKFQSQNLSTEIVLGEAGAYEYLYKAVSGKESRSNQIDYFFGSNSTKNVMGLPNIKKTISAHSYWQAWPLTELVNSRQLAASRVQGNPGLSLWSTEYCVLENPGTNELPGGAGPGRDLGIETALWTARIISTDIAVGGVTSWQWWTAISRGDYKDGLIHVDDGVSNGAGNADYCKYDGMVRETKILWALGNYSYFIKPGMVRVQVPSIDANSAVNNVMVTAYKDVESKKMVMVAVNMTKTDKVFKLDLGKATLKDNKLTPYVTSDVYNLSKINTMDVNALRIPARAVTTFVGTLN